MGPTAQKRKEKMPRRRGSLQLEKNGIWTARVRVGNKKYCRSTGTDNWAEAEASLERLVLIADCGRKSLLDQVALLRAWPRYEASSFAVRLAPKSRNVKYRAWLHFSVWLHGAHPEVNEPKEVTRAMAQEYLAFFQGGHAPVTTSLRICYLREMFRIVLASSGDDIPNPWSGVRTKAGPVCTRRELTLDEVARLLAAADGVGREWRTLFAIAIYTGMRLGDCCLLGWDAVNLVSSAIQIVPRKTRRYFAGRPIVIPLHPELASLLGETRPEQRVGHVMASIARDFESRRWVVSRTLKRIFAAADISSSILLEGRERRTPLATFHSLRHTFVSIAVNAGVPLATVQSIVGHTSTAMTRHYYHPSEDALRQAINAIPSVGAPTPLPLRDAPTAPQTVGRDHRARRSPRPSLCARLRELERAKKRGLISAEEFVTLRQTILADA